MATRGWGTKQAWGIAAGVTVAFLVGGMVGAVVEHERALRKSDTAAAGLAQLEVTSPGEWFKNNPLACPPLLRRQAAAAAAFTAFGQGAANWGAARATMLQQNSEGTAALRELLPLVSPTGNVEIQWLIEYDADLGKAMTDAASAGEYSTAAAALTSDRTTRDLTFLQQAAAFCPAP